jgi:hypothetical protein
LGLLTGCEKEEVVEDEICKIVNDAEKEIMSHEHLLRLSWTIIMLTTRRRMS